MKMKQKDQINFQAFGVHPEGSFGCSPVKASIGNRNPYSISGPIGWFPPPSCFRSWCRDGFSTIIHLVKYCPENLFLAVRIFPELAWLQSTITFFSTDFLNSSRAACWNTSKFGPSLPHAWPNEHRNSLLCYDRNITTWLCSGRMGVSADRMAWWRLQVLHRFRSWSRQALKAHWPFLDGFGTPSFLLQSHSMKLNRQGTESDRSRVSVAHGIPISLILRRIF